jgi:hypothetical protein
MHESNTGNLYNIFKYLVMNGLVLKSTEKEIAQNELSTLLNTTIVQCEMSMGAIIFEKVKKEPTVESNGFMFMNAEILQKLSQVFDNDGVNIITDVRKDKRLNQFLMVFNDNNIRSLVVSKVFSSTDEELGVLFLAHSEVSAFTNAHLVDVARMNSLIAVEVSLLLKGMDRSLNEKLSPRLNKVADEFVKPDIKQLYSILEQFDKVKTKLYEKNSFFWDQRDEKYFKQFDEAQRDLILLVESAVSAHVTKE